MLGSFIVRVSESQPGRYAISALQGSAIQHLLVIPSYAGSDPNAPGGTRYRLGETSRILFNTVRDTLPTPVHWRMCSTAY
jgi:hypothetical protein